MKEYSLSVRDLTVGYGEAHIVKGVTLSVEAQSITTILGKNGAGKSTILKALFGLLPNCNGSVCLDMEDISRLGPRKLLRMGMAYLPQSCSIFPNLSVAENLNIWRRNLGIDVTEERARDVLEKFPVLLERKRQLAGTLSGGEQQILGIAGVLMIAPRLLLLDEPTRGLAPRMRQTILGQIRRVNHEEHVTVLMVEQNVRDIVDMSKHIYVISEGIVSFSGAPTELIAANSSEFIL
jgi:ABC-type branched-subunit amino acid transport system ATPase component